MRRFSWITITAVIIVMISFSYSAVFAYHTHNSNENTMDDLEVFIAEWFAPPISADNSLSTHPNLTLGAIELFEEVDPGKLTDDIKKAIIKGSIEEDYDMLGTSTLDRYSHLEEDDVLDTFSIDGINSERCENHFMNYSSDEDGLSYSFLEYAFAVSALKWALGGDTVNTANWLSALNKAKNGANESEILEGWVYLGHVLHLLQDMASPAHVRNDPHILGDTIEEAAAKIWLSPTVEMDAVYLSTVEEYFNNLSALTRKHFFSDDTVFKSSYRGIDLPVAEISRSDDEYFYGIYDDGAMDYEYKLAYKGARYRWEFPAMIEQGLSESDALELSKKVATLWDVNDEIAIGVFNIAGKEAIRYCAGLIKKFYYATEYTEIGTISGYVTISGTVEPLPAAKIRLDIPNSYIQVTTDSSGYYSIPVPSLGSYFLLSVGKEGYIPQTANISKNDLLETGNLTQDFAIDVVQDNVLILEIFPAVHHLGDDIFSGTINSQFQQVSEGLEYIDTFITQANQLPPYYTTAEIHITAKGAQINNPVQINDVELGFLNTSPSDGSFGEIIIPFYDISILSTELNTLRINSVETSTYDDFEFANVLIYLYE